MKLIDFRSDTTTLPTQKMREAMFEAVVGDDVYRDDPTVLKLEALAAQRLGMKAAMFVVSGTMGNQLAIMSHTQRGDEIITGYEHHIVVHEVGAMAVLSGVNVHATVPTIRQPDDIIRGIREKNIHFPRTSLVCLENALSNGEVISKESFNLCIQIAKQHNLLVHVDGARIFNAAKALHVEAKELVQGADSVMFCLSKGLGAPVGSILAGSFEFIEIARKNRKLIGGGWRQAGILAAAGIVALTEMIDRLEVDHQNATLLYSLLKETVGISLEGSTPDINMVFFYFDSPIDDESYLDYVKQHNMLVNPPEGGMYRIVSHVGIQTDHIHQFIQITRDFLKKNRNL
jgi:threonine aldolase